ncbi:TonB-dependent receptor [Sulfurimonas sp. SAG-AH-194-L11]|nr:TonB-dependent receptor [Sulfurimonas sp. SAG-AH-194-L11]
MNLIKGREEEYFFAQLSYKKDFNDFSLQTKLNYSNRQSDISGYLSNSVSDIASAFGVVGVDMQEAFYVRDAQTEENIEAEAILTLPEIFSNDISIGLGIRGVSMSRNDFYSSAENAITQNYNTIVTSPNYQYFPFRAEKEPAYWQDVNSTDIFSNTNRTISYAHIQDLISVNKSLDFVAGARADYYSDIGMNYSARLGLVYRANDALIFKLLYGSAFRAPTFTEEYTNGHIGYRAGNTSLKPEETNTYETAIIYKPNFHNKFALNLYYSTLTNVIDLEEKSTTIPGYQNMKPRTSKGLEFEYFFKTQQTHNLYFNASYIEAGYTVPAEDDSVEIDQDMPDISKLMLKAMYIFHPLKALSFGTTWQYYSQTTKTKLLWVVSTNRDTPVQEYHLVDETITYNFLNNSELRLSIKNIFNEEVRLPSYYYTLPGGVLREGTNYYLTYSYNF